MSKRTLAIENRNRNRHRGHTMNRITIAALVALVVTFAGPLAVPQLAQAADAGPDAAPAAADTVPGTTADEVEPGSNEDLEQRLADLTAKYKALKAASPTEKRIAIAGLLGAVVWLLIAAFKRVGQWKSTRWIPWAVLGMGVVVGVVDKYALGAGWLNALISGGGPPLSVLIQELLKFRKG